MNRSARGLVRHQIWMNSQMSNASRTTTIPMTRSRKSLDHFSLSPMRPRIGHLSCNHSVADATRINRRAPCRLALRTLASERSNSRGTAGYDPEVVRAGGKWSELDPRTRRFIVVAGAIEGVLKIAALIDLARRPSNEVRGSKAGWAAAVSLINALGAVPIAYFTWGRRK